MSYNYNKCWEMCCMQPKSEMMATYALCGFSNLGALGILIGAVGAMVPTRRSDISRLVVRALVAGNIACFMTATIAGATLGRYEFIRFYSSSVQVFVSIEHSALVACRHLLSGAASTRSKLIRKTPRADRTAKDLDADSLPSRAKLLTLL